MKIAVIEWSSDDAMAPDVCVGTEREVLWASAVAMHEYMKRDPAYADTLALAGDPHEADLAGLWEWHQIVHEDRTIPWVTFYDYDPDEGDSCAPPDDSMNRRVLGVKS